MGTKYEQVIKILFRPKQQFAKFMKYMQMTKMTGMTLMSILSVLIQEMNLLPNLRSFIGICGCYHLAP